MKFTPIILSGGSGTRLWPISRKNFPKQFCALLDKPLQTMTFERLQKYNNPILVTSEDLKILTEKNIFENQFKVSKVIYEPVGKNTAPAVALACKFLSLENRSDEVVGIFASDALIKDTQAFDQAIQSALFEAEKNYVVTLGVSAKYPETGFGYIEVNSDEITFNKSYGVKRFHEKPDLEKAQSYIQKKNYFWNAGIFLFKVSKMIELFKVHSSELWNQIDTLKPDFSNLKQIYNSLKSDSIDFAVIEKISSLDLKCIPCDMGWSDLGSWDAVAEHSQNKAESFNVDSKENSIFTTQKKNYGFVGVDELIIVDTADALMITKKGQSQKVKDLVQLIKDDSPVLTTDHVFEHRPWGQFEILKNESYFKSKVIRVDAGQKISYQSHAHRAEHWIIVKGEATVILNEEEIVKRAGEYIYIPQGAKHRIINTSNSVVELVEVQVGTYFGEDDIVRYKDDYGRIE